MSFTYNPYKRLLALLPDTPQYIGDVVAVDGGVATIEMPGGTLATARGDVTVGQRVFFRDGVVEGTAPSLTIVEIEL